MHPLKPFFFTLKVLLLLLSLSTQKPLVDANTRNLIGFNIQQVTLNTNNNSFAYKSDDEDIINRTPLTIESEIIAEEFRYLMKFGVKTHDDHDVDTYAIPDTGSDLIWLQNRICNGEDKKHCYCDNKECREEPKDPIDCKHRYCDEILQELHINHKCSKKNKCKYSGIVYEDGFETDGILGQAEFWFTALIGKSEADRDKRKMTIGFSSKLGGDEDESKSLYQGIVGLGYGDLSLIKQYKKIKKLTFSYYLPQFSRKDDEAIKARSKFKFGEKVIISDKSTSLLTKKDDDECDIRYCVHLKGISLKFEDKNHEIKTDTHNKVMIIDSGSTFTYLTHDIFGEFIQKVKEKLNVEPKKFDKYYDNCFEKNDENKKKLEKISFEFSGTKIELKRENFLDDFTPPTESSNEDQKHYICLTVQGENEKYHKRLRNYGKSLKRKYHILGSRAQMDFLVAFNLAKGNKIVSFDHLEDKHIEESLVLSSE